MHTDSIIGLPEPRTSIPTYQGLKHSATCWLYTRLQRSKRDRASGRFPTVALARQSQGHQQRDQGQGSPSPTANASTQGNTTLIWFKADLRTDDHPGMKLAESAAHVLPVYCFDPLLQTQLLRTPNGLEGLCGAVESLQRQLREKGSHLLIVEGSAVDCLPQLAAQYGASRIITEEEVEYRWQQAMVEVEGKLPPETELQTWKASLYKNRQYGDDFRSFQKSGGNPEAPLQFATLPKLPQMGDQELSLVDQDCLPRWRRLLEGANAVLLSPQIREASENFSQGWGLNSTELVKSVAKGGESEAVLRLREYLDMATSDAKVSSEMEMAVQQSETRVTPLGSFPAIFAHALSFGTLSRRRIFWEAQRMLEVKTVLQRLTAKWKTAQSALVTAEAADFHWHIARADRIQSSRTGTVPRHWRWRGFLTDYFTAVPEAFDADPPDPNKPAFLLVHGFGAFGEQWRGQLRGLAAAGHMVYAPTLPGYGRAEKPSLPYSQKLWVDFLRDFVVEVVRSPVVVVGNSIGGFLSASLAADHPQLVQGLVLMNSAGLIVKGYKPEPNLAENGAQPTAADPVLGPPGIVADVVTSALLFYLEKTITRVLSRAYPVNPTMADAWLSAEIARAARDPGAKGVFRSVFYLPKPRPINYLVGELFAGKTLILQGRKDPMQNAPKRASQMKKLCPNVEVHLVDAGHCPFDESPDLCNQELDKFMNSLSLIPAAPLSEDPDTVLQEIGR